MIAPTPDHPDSEEERSSRGVFVLGALLVPPCYILLGWLLVRWLGEEPVVSTDSRFMVFAALCALGLASAVVSFWAKTRWRERRVARLNNMEVGTLVALALAEGPAFIGLVYHYIYRHGLGFTLFLLMSAATFVVHAFPRQSGAPHSDDLS